jgi:hypothetical protein
MPRWHNRLQHLLRNTAWSQHDFSTPLGSRETTTLMGALNRASIRSWRQRHGNASVRSRRTHQTEERAFLRPGFDRYPAERRDGWTIPARYRTPLRRPARSGVPRAGHPLDLGRFRARSRCIRSGFARAWDWQRRPRRDLVAEPGRVVAHAVCDGAHRGRAGQYQSRISAGRARVRAKQGGVQSHHRRRAFQVVDVSADAGGTGT